MRDATLRGGGGPKVSTLDSTAFEDNLLTWVCSSSVLVVAGQLLLTGGGVLVCCWGLGVLICSSHLVLWLGVLGGVLGERVFASVCDKIEKLFESTEFFCFLGVSSDLVRVFLFFGVDCNCCWVIRNDP